MKGIRIGVDAKRLFHNKEGLGSYARTLIADLQYSYPNNEYYLYTPSISDNSLADQFTDNDDYKVRTPRNNNYLWRSKGIIQDLIRDEIDVYIGLSNELPFGIEKSGIKSILILHDMIYKRFPSQYKTLDRVIVNKKVKHSVNVADVIIAPSEHTAEDIKHYFPEVCNKVKVIYQSVSPGFRIEKDNSHYRPKHFLCVGTINERKNFKLVIQALELLEDSTRPNLVIVGEGKKYKNELLDMIEKAHLSESVKILQGISESELIKLYLSSIALIMPSAYEGFGIPVLEALSLSVPVIISNQSSLPEIAGQHGIVIDYLDRIALAKAIKQLTNPREKTALLDHIGSHLEKFEASTISQQYFSVIESIL